MGRWGLLLGLAAWGVACGSGDAPPETTDSTVVPASPDTMTIDRVLRTDDRFSTLVAALDSTGLDSTLRQSGPYTLFAPPNTAFEALPPGTVETLLDDRPARLRLILRHHIVPRQAAVAGRSGSWTLPTLDGDTLRLARTDTATTIRNARVLDGDIETANGLIHVIDRVLRPPSSAAPTGE